MPGNLQTNQRSVGYWESMDGKVNSHCSVFNLVFKCRAMHLMVMQSPASHHGNPVGPVRGICGWKNCNGIRERFFTSTAGFPSILLNQCPILFIFKATINSRGKSEAWGLSNKVMLFANREALRTVTHKHCSIAVGRYLATTPRYLKISLREKLESRYSGM